MAYYPAAHKAIINVPKCGTSTNDEAIMRLTGDRSVIAGGHFNAGVMARVIAQETLFDPDNPPEFAMSVRHPWERFVSALNHHYGRASHSNDGVSNLDEAMEACETSTSKVFSTQRSWHSSNVYLFPFEGLPILRWLGYNGPPIHENKGPRRWGADQIQGHSLFSKRIERYAEDAPLYKIAREGKHYRPKGWEGPL